MDDSPLRAIRMHEWMLPKDRQRTIWVKNVSEALTVLRDYTDSIEIAHLDYELTDEEDIDSRQHDCGMEVVRWLENIPENKRNKFINCTFIIHTHNKHEGIEMVERINNLKLKAKYQPFGL